ncbi:MAG: YicC family protein [Clostridia bacterium]|nr:YicC family protein [Clostridia bacterium]
MIRSMTAYGRAKHEDEARSVLVEIKSVNNRYLDCTVKLPRLFGFLEEKIKARLTERGISRGKIDVYVNIDVIENTGIEVELDTAYVQSYLAALRKLSETFGLANDVTTMRIAQNRDIFTVKKADEDIGAEWERFRPILDEAIDAFLLARETEGANMKADIIEKRKTVEALAEKIAPLSKADIDGQFEKLQERIKAIAGDSVQFDENRLLTECAIAADKLAIDEELVRLSSHFKAFDQIVESGEPVGRKLDFLLQEINRETNTIGSKVNNAEIGKIVVDMKSELEKIREQIQNIE